MDKKFPTKLTKLSGTLAERPESPLTNMIYFATDEPDSPISFWDGSSWSSGGGGVSPELELIISKDPDNIGLGTDIYSSLTGNYNKNNVALGSNVMNASMVNASYNVALGDNTLNNISNGNYNVALGRYASNKLTTGTSNIAIGISALQNHTDGYANIAIGSSAAQNRNKNDSDYSIAIGCNAMGEFTTEKAIAIGYEAMYYGSSHTNIAIGFQAMKGINKSGAGGPSSYCTAIGYQSQAKSTSPANFLTSIGTFTLNYNTTGARNTAVGTCALYQSTTGSFNTAHGASSLYNNKTGSHNTAVGSYALEKNKTGSNLTAVGSNALKNTTGVNNTAVGSYALEETTGGGGNTAVGADSAHKNSSGYCNTALGHMSAYHNTEGSHNTSIGYSAMMNNYGGGNYNTCIGTESKLPSSDGSNYFVLGSRDTSNLRCNDTSISSLSDKRDKKDVKNCSYGLDYINKLRPVEFEWDYRKEHYAERDGELVPPTKQGRKDVGFIAQELKKVQDKYKADSLNTYQHYPPETDKEGKLMEGDLGIDVLEADYGKLLPVAIQAIKDLSAKVDILEREVTRLGGDIKPSLRSRIVGKIKKLF